MLEEDRNKTRKLLAIVAITFGLFCTILVFGLLTRPKVVEIPTTFEKESASSEAACAATKHALVMSINKLSNSLDALRFEIEKAKEKPLSPKEQYWAYAHEITAKYYPDVNPEYAFAIIYHESRYQPDVVNKKTGVVGLMQINPKWHTKRAKALGVIDLKDPYGNILVGCDILHELTQKEDFNYALNFFAGGYPYANKYRNTKSPYVKSLEEIMATENIELISASSTVGETRGEYDAAC